MNKFYGTGRRKSSTARVYIKKSKKPSIKVNNKDLGAYFSRLSDYEQILAPLKDLDVLTGFEITAFTKGGGMTGQAGAISLGLARALDNYELHLLGLTAKDFIVTEGEETEKTLPERPWHKILRAKGHLTRDPRSVLRKLVGLVKARKAKQFSKR